MKLIRNLAKTWLPLAIVIVFLSAVIYTTIQQNFRIGANDPQIQLAEDAAAALENKQPIDAVIPSGKVDIAVSLAPYLVYYSADGKPAAGSGYLHGSLPDLPAGVFDFTRQNQEDRLSWQPEAGVRSATVIVAVDGGKGGYVLAGRSLREVEKRVDNLTLLVGAGCAGTLAATLILCILLEILPVAPRQPDRAG